MPPLPLVIVNPASAGGATRAAWPSIASDLRRHFGPFECAFTERESGAASIAESEARGGRRFIVACGGDGTVSEAADGILRSGTDAELGLLPSGTGGDFRRTFDFPTRAADAALALRRGRTRRIDAGLATYADEAGAARPRHFVNVASLGMGGDVIGRVKRGDVLGAGLSRLAGGRVAFAAAALRTAFEFEKPLVSISLDGGPESRLKVTNFCVANARYFGGGMRIAPTALADDGLFDAVAVGDLGPLSILANSYRVYLGTHLGMEQVRHARARRVEAAPADSSVVRLEVDGELVGRLPATFEILPAALRLRVPA
ncbi:MAG TPA: diacylglycerol kinase family protein [Pyrinomonadaceae bacterium]|nr:diacylglycerol kinase family protein [Pyrinomonadaceae bacterium]